MNIFEQLEKYLKEKNSDNKIAGNYLPEIRYFDGYGTFSDLSGNFQSKSLEKSLELFLEHANKVN
jgi:hypothetical protein